MFKSGSLLVILLFAFLMSKAEYTVTENCAKAWEAITNLNTETAKQYINQEMIHNPDNYYVYYVANTCDAFNLKINGSDELYDQFVEDYEYRRGKMDGNDEDSPYYLYCEAEMLLQMAMMNVLYGDRFSGVRKGYKSYKKVYDNIKAFPDFQLNKKLEGFFNIAIANLPSFIRWAVSSFGISGNSEKGFQLMHEYFESVKDDAGLNAEAALYTLFSFKLNKEPVKAFDFIRVQDSSITNKRLIKYFYANTAYRSGHNAIAYESFSTFYPEKMEIFFLPYDYMMGKIMLRKLDPQATYHLKRFVEYAKEDNYGKEILYKIALSYLVAGNVEEFEVYKTKARKADVEVTERDREANYDCNLDYQPDIRLAKCKLLLDGGYHEEFAETFLTYPSNNFSEPAYKLEYGLMKGRYELILGNDQLAVSTFEAVIADGKDEDYYFASDAALRMGMYYLPSDTTKAKTYFEKTLNLYDSDYYEYIEEIAKRELKRIKK